MTFGDGYDSARTVVLQPDGKIVVLGASGDGAIIVRFNSNGSLDSSFGTNGVVISSVSGFSSYGSNVALQSDGKIVVTDYVYNN